MAETPIHVNAVGRIRTEDEVRSLLADEKCLLEKNRERVLILEAEISLLEWMLGAGIVVQDWR